MADVAKILEVFLEDYETETGLNLACPNWALNRLWEAEHIICNVNKPSVYDEIADLYEIEE